MIACVSPGNIACEHTLNTLRYADRVKEFKVNRNMQPLVKDEAALRFECPWVRGRRCVVLRMLRPSGRAYVLVLRVGGGGWPTMCLGSPALVPLFVHVLCLCVSARGGALYRTSTCRFLVLCRL